MGDKGGKKGKEKSQKQKIMKHEHEMQQKKEHQPKSTFGAKQLGLEGDIIGKVFTVDVLLFFATQSWSQVVNVFTSHFRSDNPAVQFVLQHIVYPDALNHVNNTSPQCLLS